MPNEAMKKLQPFFEKKDRLNHLLAVINFDIETCAPEDAIEEEIRASFWNREGRSIFLYFSTAIFNAGTFSFDSYITIISRIWILISKNFFQRISGLTSIDSTIPII